MLKKRLFSLTLAIAMFISVFSFQIYAAETIEGSDLQKLAMTASDVQQCYSMGKEMLANYYSAEIYGTNVNLDSYFSAPMLKAYTNEKVNTKKLIAEDCKDNMSMLSTEFTLYDYNVSNNYIFVR